MVRFSKSRIVIFLAVILLVAAGVLLLIQINKEDAKKAEAQEQQATVVAMETAATECKKAGIDPEACSHLTSVVSTTECNGKVCWSVYAQVDEPEYFGASMLVGLKNGKYTTTDYMRNTAE